MGPSTNSSDLNPSSRVILDKEKVEDDGVAFLRGRMEKNSRT